MKSFFALVAILAVTTLAADQIPIDDITTSDIQKSDDPDALAASYGLSLYMLQAKAQANDIREVQERRDAAQAEGIAKDEKAKQAMVDFLEANPLNQDEDKDEDKGKISR